MSRKTFLSQPTRNSFSPFSFLPPVHSRSLTESTLASNLAAFGLAAFVFVCAIVLWWFLRRRKARRTNPSASNTSTTTHNSFTSLASLFRRPFSRRSNNAPPLDSTTASKRGWLHGSARDWNEIEEDESDLVGGRGRPGESMELYNQISKNNPDPVGTMERRGSKSPLPGESPLFPPSGGSHPYGQGGGATSSNSLGNFASTSTIRLASPAADGGTPQEYRDHSPFEEGGSESGYFTPSEETRAEERPRVLQGERPLSGKFREDDNHSVDSRRCVRRSRLSSRGVVADFSLLFLQPSMIVWVRRGEVYSRMR